MLSELFNLEKIFGFCEKICYFFVVNLLFILAGLPVLLFFMFVGISQARDCLPLFLTCMIPVPLGLSAVFFAMNRLLHGIETGPVRDFRKGFVSDLKKKLKVSGGQMLVLLILWTNIEFFSREAPFLPFVILFALLFTLAILVTPYLYLLLSRYEMPALEAVKAACVLTITRPVCTLGNVAAFAVILMAMEISAGTTVLFMGSVYGFLVVFINRNVLRALEEQ